MDSKPTRRERIQQAMGESTPEEKRSLIKELLDDLGANITEFLEDIYDWIRKRKPVFRHIESGKHRRWTNHTEDQVVEPLQFLVPGNLKELVDIITTAEEYKCTVRAVGSGHSFSDITQTHDFLVCTDNLNRAIDLDETVLKSGVLTKHLVHVEAGIKIYQLNDLLDERGLALPNMGGYDGQSLAGALSTSTHGSGITFGPLASMYKSIVLVGEEGKIYRIEPTDGITDPEKFKEKYPDTELKQDDEWFNTVAVSMGCTGVIYSAIIEVRPAFWLKEVRTLQSWSAFRKQLEDGTLVQKYIHVEVLVNPYVTKKDHTCLVTTRSEVGQPTETITDKNERNFISELLGLIPGMIRLIDFILLHFPHVMPTLIDKALHGLEDDAYIHKSYKVFNVGTTNNLKAFGAEFALPMENGIYLNAIDKIFKVAAKMAALGNVYHTSPISIRFVKKSNFFLSMMEGRDTVMIEMGVASGSYGGFQLLEQYELALLPYKMRPHWGMVNSITSNDLLRSLYPLLPNWKRVFDELNKKGTFSNKFTYRCGFSKYPTAASL